MFRKSRFVIATIALFLSSISFKLKPMRVAKAAVIAIALFLSGFASLSFAANWEISTYRNSGNQNVSLYYVLTSLAATNDFLNIYSDISFNDYPITNISASSVTVQSYSVNVRTLDGNSYQGFSIGAQKNITFKNLQFINFRYSSSYVGDRGVFRLYGQSQINFTGRVVFENNFSIFNGYSGGRSTITFLNANVIVNTNAGSYSNIYYVFNISNYSLLDFTNSYIQYASNGYSNTSYEQIYLEGGRFVLNNSSGEFLGNYGYYAGVIYANRESSVSFTASGNIIFRDNRNRYRFFSNDIYINNGSGLYMDAKTYKIMFLSGISVQYYSTVTFRNSAGGGFQLEGHNFFEYSRFEADQSLITVSSGVNAGIGVRVSSFIFAGGGFALTRSTINFLNMSFIYFNTPISLNSSLMNFINISSGLFRNNSSYSVPAAISLTNGSALNFTNSRSSFTYGYGVNAGAIYAAGGSSIGFTANSNNDVVFYYNWMGVSDSNRAPNDIYLDKSKLILNANTYRIFMYGGVQAFNGSTITWTQGVGGRWILGYHDAPATLYADYRGYNQFDNMGLFSISQLSSITVANSTFIYSNNKKSLELTRSTISFINGSYVSFTGNSGTGGISLITNSVMSAINSTVNFTANTTSSSGGAISLVTNSVLNIIGSSATFLNNTATGNGGAINATAGSVINIVAGGNITFRGNRSGSGANITPNDIYMDNARLNISANTYQTRMESGIKAINNSQIVWTWTTGGGVMVLGGANEFNNIGLWSIPSGSSVTVMNASWTWTSNTTANNNLVLNRSTMSFIRSKVNFISNTNGSGNGGAINIDGNGRLNVLNGSISFINNTASVSGGGLHIDNAVANIINTTATFVGNTATGGYGGGIYLGSGGAINFTNSSVTITGNKASLGAGIYLYMATSILTFTNTRAVIDANTLASGALGSGIYNAGVININSGSNILIRKNTLVGSGNINVASGGLLRVGQGGSNVTGTLAVTAGTFSVVDVGAYAVSTKAFNVTLLTIGAGSVWEMGIEGNTDQSDIILGAITISGASRLNIVAYSALEYVKKSYVLAQGAVTGWQNLTYDTENFILSYNSTSNQLLLSMLKLAEWDIYSWSDPDDPMVSLWPIWNNLAVDGSVLNVHADIGFGLALSATTTWRNLEVLGIGGSKTFSGNGSNIAGLSLSSKTITFSDINFNNFIKSGDGGAIWSNRSTITFSGNIGFSNNRATGLGGAIYNSTGSLIIFDGAHAIFSGNTANGGALRAGGDIYSMGNIDIRNGSNIILSGGINGGGNISITGSILRVGMDYSSINYINVSGSTFSLFTDSAGSTKTFVVNGINFSNSGILEIGLIGRGGGLPASDFIEIINAMNVGLYSRLEVNMYGSWDFVGRVYNIAHGVIYGWNNFQYDETSYFLDYSADTQLLTLLLRGYSNWDVYYWNDPIEQAQSLKRLYDEYASSGNVLNIRADIGFAGNLSTAARQWDALTIQGMGETAAVERILSGMGQWYGFYVVGKQLTFKDIIFDRFYFSTARGTGDGLGGGAIWLSGSTAVFSGAITFTQNSALGGATAGIGGAIYATLGSSVMFRDAVVKAGLVGVGGGESFRV